MVTAQTLVEKLIGRIGRPFRCRITGFPACGKTTLSKLISEQIKGIGHLESESWMYSLEYRKQRDLSGSHPDGYEIEKAVKEIRAFLRGETIFMQYYSHQIGDRLHGSSITPIEGSPMILDGTPFSLSEFDALVPSCIFLRPASLEDWLQASIRRDVETRYFSKAEATRHNMRKARDMEIVLTRSPNAHIVTCHIPEMLYDTDVYQ